MRTRLQVSRISFFKDNGMELAPGSYWWLNPSAAFQTAGSVPSAGSSYATGFYPFTAPTTPSCIRQPSGVWLGSSAVFQQVDPGLGCPAATPTLNAAAIAANIPGSGAQQATSTTTCAIVGGLAVVTTHVAVAHGLTPGLTYAMGSFNAGFTGYNSASYTALLGTAGTTLVGTTGGGTSCPALVVTA